VIRRQRGRRHRPRQGRLRHGARML
jgi:hypothetical protein